MSLVVCFNLGNYREIFPIIEKGFGLMKRR